MGIAFMELLILIGIVVILPIIIICIIVGRKKSAANQPVPQQPDSIDPAERNRQREAILEKLAKKELSREAAEQELLELDKPLPEKMPPPPPRSNKGCGTGCLVVVIAGFIALVVLLLLFMGSFRLHRVSNESEVRVEIEEVQP